VGHEEELQGFHDPIQVGDSAHPVSRAALGIAHEEQQTRAESHEDEGDDRRPHPSLRA
jgi:hypothetical protein